MSGFVTSPAASFSTAGFSDAERTDIRRLCGYPPYGGIGNVGFQGWRFYQAYGLLEFRMSNLAPAELQNVRSYLSQLYPIETALFGSYQTLNVDEAGPFKRNANEVANRAGQLDMMRRRLCTLVGVPPGPDLSGGSTVELVV
jgi:hypothetical protein